MILDRLEIKNKLKILLGKRYQINNLDHDSLKFDNRNNIYIVTNNIRLQYLNYLTLKSFSFTNIFFEKQIQKLISNELQEKYQDDIYFTHKKFYTTDFDFNFQEIKTEEELDIYLQECVKCIEYHEQEVFPKLLDIDFLAEYVSVPFEQQLEIPVGGKFPVNLFKKMAILKWGHQEERYQEYKENALIRIEKYAINKPDRYDPVFKTNFESIVYHLENEPNPFEKE